MTPCPNALASRTFIPILLEVRGVAAFWQGVVSRVKSPLGPRILASESKLHADQHQGHGHVVAGVRQLRREDFGVHVLAHGVG